MQAMEEAPEVDSHLISKSGYLVKFAKLKENAKKLKNFRNRYFILNANSFTYYGSHKSLNMAKGNVLLIAGSKVEDMEVENFEFSFRLTTPFETLVMAAKSAEDRESWKIELERAINYAQYALRGYMIKKGKSFLEGSPRKFFVFWNNILSFHADHEHTAMTQWAIEFSMDTNVSADDSKLLITVSDSMESVRIQFEKRNADEYPIWKDALLDTADKFNKIKGEEIAAVEKVLEEATMNGNLQLRPETGGDDWPNYLVALTGSALVIIEQEQVNDDEHFKIIEEHILRPDCTVKQTLLKAFSFQFATVNTILHFAADSPEQIEFWLSALGDAIKDCSPVSGLENSAEVLYRESLPKIMQDVFYDVHFNDKIPLGMVLEKVAEWAIVKISNFEESGVKVGSVLSAINNVAVVTSPYDEIVAQLQEWEPPLTLTFRQAPEKSGYLTKMVSVSKENPKWKPRFFILSEGKLTYKKEDSPDSHIRDGLPLKEAKISLVPAGEYTDRFYCFQVLSGVKTFIMEASDVDEWREWTAMIYHAISVANGAAYILEYEFERYKEEEERLVAMEEFQRQKYDEAYNAIIEKIYKAIEDKNLEDLDRLLAEAIAGGMEGEKSVQYAIRMLQTFRIEQQQREDDEKIYKQAYLAKQEEEEKNWRLEKEYMELQEKVGLDENDVEDDDDIEQDLSSRMSVATIFGSVSSSLVATVSSPGPSSSSTSSTTAIFKLKRRMSVGSSRRGVVPDMIENDDEVAEDVPIVGTIQDEKTLLHIQPATVENLKSLFRKYAKSSSDGAYINVMQFSGVFRLVTGQKGNLYNEMKMFNKFDASGKGFMIEDDFVNGWMNEAMERNNDDYLKKREENMDVQLEDTLNQRWKNDKSGFGFKMLQKMGWKEDKGLGKNETGIVSSVKIKKRENSVGLGMEKEVDLAGNTGWSETVNSYNDVLAILKSTYNTKEKNPDKKRKTTKSITVGIKYKKIRESKDLSTKSSADMRAILGTTTITTTSSKSSIVLLPPNSESAINEESLLFSNEKVVDKKKVKKDKKHRKKNHDVEEIES